VKSSEHDFADAQGHDKLRANSRAFYLSRLDDMSMGYSRRNEEISLVGSLWNFVKDEQLDLKLSTYSFKHRLADLVEFETKHGRSQYYKTRFVIGHSYIRKSEKKLIQIISRIDKNF